MSTAFRCPRCQGIIASSPALAGQKMRCPHCGTGVKYPAALMPTQGELLPPEPPPATPAQVVVIGSQPERRLDARGWLGRSFASTFGVVLGLLAIPALLVASIFLATTGFLAWEALPEESPVSGAAEQALSVLRPYNITSLADDATSERRGELVTLSGRGLDTRDVLHRIAIRWTVADFGRQRRWQLESIVIDGRTVHARAEALNVSDTELNR